ncbi:MAG: ribose-phosphate pyrophosphokinase [Oscillospiraceae bacterium]|jgi:ribose-phosphate pyrophosphokinase|nr:ribose-phosphate pyrophosphokinase [Oscillospiraceae bacterium]
MASANSAVRIISGNSNPELARKIADYHPAGGRAIECVVSKFKDGEVSVSIEEPVRGADVFIIQSTCKYGDNDVNDNLMELLVVIDACKRASAHRITAVMPYFGYARQDRKAKARDPITAKLVANLLTTAGADRVLTMDLHADQIQGFFDIPVDNMLAGKLLAEHYINVFGKDNPDFTVVSPDVGSVKRARNFAERLGMNLAIVDKRREVANKSEVMNIIGDVRGKNVILFDDMVDTAGSLCNAAVALRETGGAEKIYACASHGVLSGPALERINASYIEILRLVDTIPYPANAEPSPKIQYISCAEMFARAVDRIHEEISISEIFR